MKTKMRKQSLPKRKKIPSELMPNRPPVGDRWELLDFENEYKDNWLWVALCVVEGYGKVWLKLFIWRWAGFVGICERYGEIEQLRAKS